MNKKLMNEVLPAPTVIGGNAVRERVIQKMRLALAAGAATLALNGCPPFAVVDPLPPPALCANDGGPASQVTATATLDVGAPQRRFKVDVKPKTDSGLTFDPNASATGCTVLQQLVTGSSAAFTVVPDASATEVTISIPVTCNNFRGSGPTPSVLVITLTDLGSNTPTVTVTDVPAPDGGFADGGSDGGSDGGTDGGSDGGP